MEPRGPEGREQPAAGAEHAVHEAQAAGGIAVVLEAVEGHDDVGAVVEVTREEAAVGHADHARGASLHHLDGVAAGAAAEVDHRPARDV
jgi:hypothetical protein